MNNFNWSKALGYGVLIWGVAVLVLAGLVYLTPISAAWAHGITAFTFGLLAYLFALNAKPADASHALGYGVVWAAIGLALDGIIMRNFDAHFFASWQYWIGYVLVLLAPLLRLELPKSRTLST